MPVELLPFPPSYCVGELERRSAGNCIAISSSLTLDVVRLRLSRGVPSLHGPEPVPTNLDPLAKVAQASVPPVPALRPPLTAPHATLRRLHPLAVSTVAKEHP